MEDYGDGRYHGGGAYYGGGGLGGRGASGSWYNLNVMEKKAKFTEEEKQRISDAVKDLEGPTAGELVPYYVPQSNSYDEASWYLATMLGALTVVIFGVMSYFLPLIPFRITPVELAVAIFVWIAIGYVVPKIFPEAKRLLISREKMLNRVTRKSEELFLKEEVFNTGDRIGVLLFISQLEHMVIVLGDKGINEKLKAGDWEHVVNTILTSIKNNRLVDGYCRCDRRVQTVVARQWFR